jgi:type IV pilus assembly protein PilN
MRISINLATRPFVELGPLFARLRLAMAGLALLAVVLGVTLHSMNKRAATAEGQMDALKQQTAGLESERLTNENRMRQSQNKAVLDRSRFLNSLFASKSFSWTAVMMDLERVLPGGVQVTSIEPAVSADGNVNIHLRVNGPRDLQVDLLRNLERSQRFALPRLSNETAQTQDTGRVVTAAQTTVPGAVEFDILSGYNPLPLQMKATTPKAATASGAAKAAGPGKAKAAGPATPGKKAKLAVPAAKKPVVPGVVH